MLCGITLLFFGLCRLGWIIEFIPYVPISAFVTAASITIMSTQLPTIFGIPAINKQAPPYRVLIDTAKALPQMKLDAAIGLSSIVLLWSIREFCSRMEARQPTHKRVWTVISSLRLSFTMLLFMLISFLVHGREPMDPPKFRIVGRIERGEFHHGRDPRLDFADTSPGFQEIGIPTFNLSIARAVLSELPAVAIILVIEHVAIAKAMGRRHNYTVDPSQEIVALGGANLLSPFVGGYVCTGSFGASAVLSKAGVRTPLAGLFSALMLVLALYALTGAFFYIPRAALSGLIIHAVCNLITPPNSLYNYWQLSPIEFLIWIACVAIAIFHSLDYCIYLGVTLSVVLLLVRVARANGGFVGVARSRRVSQGTDDAAAKPARDCTATKDVFLQFDRKDSSNPAILLQTPYPGVFVYRLHDSFNYINQALHVDILQSHLMENTKRASDEEYERASDRLWNDAGPRSKLLSHHLPHLRALVLDFSAVNNIDITSVQGLIDLRNLLDRYAAPDTVEWHFANVQNRWARRALARAGFGYPTSQNPEALAKWKPIYSIAPIQDEPIPRRHAPSDKRAFTTGSDEESQGSPTLSRSTTSLETTGESSSATISAVDRPFFHLDLHDAVEAAVRDARHKDKISSGDGQ